MIRYIYYYTCPCCGANLDPDERCDCRENEPSDRLQSESIQAD